MEVIEDKRMKVLDDTTPGGEESNKPPRTVPPIPVPPLCHHDLPLPSENVELEPGEVVLIPGLSWKCIQNPQYPTREPGCHFGGHIHQNPDANEKRVRYSRQCPFEKLTCCNYQHLAQRSDAEEPSYRTCENLFQSDQGFCTAGCRCTEKEHTHQNSFKQAISHYILKDCKEKRICRRVPTIKSKYCFTKVSSNESSEREKHFILHKSRKSNDSHLRTRKDENTSKPKKKLSSDNSYRPKDHCKRDHHMCHNGWSFSDCETQRHSTKCLKDFYLLRLPVTNNVQVPLLRLPARSHNCSSPVNTHGSQKADHPPVPSRYSVNSCTQSPISSLKTHSSCQFISLPKTSKLSFYNHTDRNKCFLKTPSSLHFASLPQTLILSVDNQIFNSPSSTEIPETPHFSPYGSNFHPSTSKSPANPDNLPEDQKLPVRALPLLHLSHQVEKQYTSNILCHDQKKHSQSTEQKKVKCTLRRKNHVTPVIGIPAESNVAKGRQYQDINGNSLHPGREYGLNGASQPKVWGGKSMEGLEVVGEVGRGSYGSVWLVRRPGSSHPRLVLKCVELAGCGGREVEAARQEVTILARLRHPNIVSYKGSFEHEGRLHVLLGYCEGGDLHTRIALQCGSPFPEVKVARWFIQITMALQYLHGNNILHRDLKTHNILLTRTGLIKVGDFGISRVLSSSHDLATTLVGTPYYMSPELLAGRPYNHKSDMWALGCVLFELATLRPPFPAHDLPSLIYRVSRGKLGVLPSHYCDGLRALVASLLFRCPDHRPTASRVLQLPYIRTHMTLFLQDTAGHTNKGKTKQGSGEGEGVWDGQKERDMWKGRWIEEEVEEKDDEEEKEEIQEGKKEMWEEKDAHERKKEVWEENEKELVRPKNLCHGRDSKIKYGHNEGHHEIEVNISSGVQGREIPDVMSVRLRDSELNLDRERKDEEGEEEQKSLQKYKDQSGMTQNTNKRSCEFVAADFGSLHISGGRMRLGERMRVEQQRPSGEKECGCPRNKHNSAGHIGSVSRTRRRNNREKLEVGNKKAVGTRLKGDKPFVGRELRTGWGVSTEKNGTKSYEGNAREKHQNENRVKQRHRKAREDPNGFDDNASAPSLTSSARERRRLKRLKEDENKETGDSVDAEKLLSMSGEEYGDEEEERECFVDLLNTTLKDTSIKHEEERDEEKNMEQEEEVRSEGGSLEAKITELEETLEQEVGQERARSVMEVLRGEDEENEEEQECYKWESEDETDSSRDEERWRKEGERGQGEMENSKSKEEECWVEEEEKTENEESLREEVEEKTVQKDIVIEAGLSPKATNTAWQLALCYSLRQGGCE